MPRLINSKNIFTIKTRNQGVNSHDFFASVDEPLMSFKVPFTHAVFPCECAARFSNINVKFIIFIYKTRHLSANSHEKSASVNEP